MGDPGHRIAAVILAAAAADSATALHPVGTLIVARLLAGTAGLPLATIGVALLWIGTLTTETTGRDFAALARRRLAIAVVLGADRIGRCKVVVVGTQQLNLRFASQ